MSKIVAFEEIIEQAKRKNNKTKSYARMDHIKKGIKTILGTIDERLDQYAQLAKEDEENFLVNKQDWAFDIEKSIDNMLNELLENITPKIVAESDAHLLNAYQNLLYNPNKLKNVYRKVKDTKPDEQKSFSLNIENNQEVTVQDILRVFREIKSQISEEEYKALEEYKTNPNYRELIRKENDEETIEIIEEKLKYVGDEEQRFIEFFKDKKIIVLENIKNKYINSLIECGSILDGFGLLVRYQNQHKNALRNVGLRKLTYEIDSGNEEEMDVKKLFNERYLRKLPIQTIVGLNVFWSNRLAKEIDEINKAKFICQDYNIYEKIIEQKITGKQDQIPIPTDEELEEELFKLEVLDNISDKCETKILKDLKKASKKEQREFKIDEYISDVSSDYENLYYEYFKNSIPSASNILVGDLRNYITSKNMISNLYGGKDAGLVYLMESGLSNIGIKNWGYINENNEDNFALLGFDIEGLNMPVKMHIDKNILRKFAKQNGLENKIHKYQGNNDFKIYGTNIDPSLLIPMDNKKKKQIKDFTIDFQKEPDIASYIEHCRYLIDIDKLNYPKHLKKLKTIGKGKKEKRKYIILEEYINIETKEVFEKDREGKFIKKDLARDIIE